MFIVLEVDLSRDQTTLIFLRDRAVSRITRETSRRVSKREHIHDTAV